VGSETGGGALLGNLQAALRSAGSVLRSLAAGHPLLILPAALRLIVRNESRERKEGEEELVVRSCLPRPGSVHSENRLQQSRQDKGVCYKW
jgi:hypothetical protein